MADVSVKMGVSGISQFKQGMSDAQASVKALDAALKTNEKQLKATGDAEAFMASQANLLQGKISALRNVAKNAEQALAAMEANGVSKTSKAYQDMQRRLVEAQGGILDAQQDMANLGKSAGEAAGETDKLARSLGGLNKKVSLEQVIGAVNSITTGMEKAAKKAAELGKAIWENITDTARYSDDIATQAMQTNMGVVEFQQWKGALETYAEMTVQEWQKAKLKVQNLINKPTDEQTSILEFLGINTHEQFAGKYGMVEGAARDFEEVFWEIGEKLQQKVASGEMKLDLAETYANAIFGRGFTGLNSIFDMGREEFEAHVKEQAAASEEAIKKNAELNDKLEEVQRQFQAVKTEITSGLAPALTSAADSIGKMLASINEYLQTDEGKEMLDRLGSAVAGLFEDLSNITPDEVVNKFTTVFNTLTNGLEWISKNWEGVKAGIEGIAIAFGLLKISEGVLEGLRLFQGLKGLFGNGGAGGGVGKIGGVGSVLTGGGASSLTTIFKNAIIGALPALGSIALGTIAITAGAVILGGSFNAQEVLNEAAQTGEQQNAELEEFNETIAAVSENEELKEAHETLAGYVVSGGKAGMEDLADLQAFAKRYIAFLRDFAEDDLMDKVSDIVFDRGNEYADEFMQVMEAVLANETDYTGETQQKVIDMITDIMYAVRQQMAKEVLEVKLVPDLEGLQSQLAVANLTASVALNAKGLGTGGMAGAMAAMFQGAGFANGLPSVPFDGMYYLHKDETVTPAREVASRSFNSNLYIENMNMSNGQDADGLAARIAAANRRTMSGFGS